MDFDSFFYKLHENIDTTNYVEKYKMFGNKLKDYYQFSSHEDTFVEIKMAPFYNSGVLYKFYFNSLNNDRTLRKIIKLVANKSFLIKSDNSNMVVEVVFPFNKINKIIAKKSLEVNNTPRDINI